jgi:hypothetical protein
MPSGRFPQENALLTVIREFTLISGNAVKDFQTEEEKIGVRYLSWNMVAGRAP